MLFFESCATKDNGDDYLLYPSAIVTAKVSATNQFYLQLDDTTTLYPKNVQPSPFGNKEIRAIVNYNILKETTPGFDSTIKLNWIDTIRTKELAPIAPDGNNEALYGMDPIEVIDDWVTIVEDGYITLRLRTMFSYPKKVHLVNLVADVNPENPYELTLYHNANGDNGGEMSDALVAFNLNSLPNTNDKVVKLKLNWRSFSGMKSAEFDYCTRRPTPSKSTINALEKFAGIQIFE
jgi:hypothetical protein